MIKLYEGGAFLVDGREIVTEAEVHEGRTVKGKVPNKEEARKGTIAYGILKEHNTSDNMDRLRIRFDAMASHDITFVGIVQTAKASGMTEFPIPYVLTNCHNSLCAVGGTINEDDHIFGLSAAKKYGGIYVPPHMAVIHQYMREMMAGCGKMIIGSDSHTRYGALGTMAVGEGGGELVKQLLCDTYDISYPGVVGIYLEGKPMPGVGPQDIAIAIIGSVFKNGYVKNKVMEFVGPGVASMNADYRNGVDVMTTETTCLSSIWRTDEKTKEFLEAHGRGDDYRELNPADVAYYDGMVHVNLSEIKPMIALPFHPSNAYTIEEFLSTPEDILRTIEKEAAVIQDNPDINFSLTDKVRDGKVHVQQGIIAGCAGGTYSSVCEAAHILRHASCGNGEFTLSVYPSSQPVFMELVKNGAITNLMAAGAAVKTAFCGPCFGAGDTPANNAFSIRHTTRNFPNREGSKPASGQLSAVALMDARSIAATAANGGVLIPATTYADEYIYPEYHFDDSSYAARVYTGFKAGDKDSELVYGPNIKDWPEMKPLADNILLKVCSKIMDDVTTTDELIPSGETSSYRSNPLGLAEFTLSRRDPQYVSRAKAAAAEDIEALEEIAGKIAQITPDVNVSDVETGSMIYCVKPGDGSAREQAASCQRVLGGLANICSEYATKRYRSNVMNWGMLPFQMKGEPDFEVGDYIYVPDIRKALDGDMKNIKAYVLGDEVKEISLYIADMTENEKRIVEAGCLINYNRKRKEKHEMDYTAHFEQLVKEQLERVERMKNAPAAPDFASMDKVVIGAIDGDGIGPIIMDSCREILNRLLADEIASGKIEIRTIKGLTIENRVEKLQSVPDDVLAEIKECDLLLKGPTMTPGKGDNLPNIESANVKLRKELDLFANVRPVVIPEKGIDWMFFRENTEGEYALGSRGIDLTDDISIDFKVTTTEGTRRLARAAFEHAKNNGNKNVTIVTKANIMKKTDGKFLELCYEMAREYPEIRTNDRYVDIMSANLINEMVNKDFNVFILPNLYGDIITDEAAQMQGGVGTAGSANIGARYAMFEAIHGSAERMIREGRGKFANPASICRAAVMMLRHMGAFEKADILEKALDAAAENVNIVRDGSGDTADDFTAFVLGELQ